TRVYVRKDRLRTCNRLHYGVQSDLLQTREVRVSPATKSNRGRPIVHTEPWAKITVVLLDRHVAYLDRLAIDIRLKHGKAISRAEIIRGLIEAAFQSGIDLSQADSIDSLVDLLVGTSSGSGKRKSAR
ncbi:MAG TPA: hypothetical protein VH087_02130, partial [Thermoanaerobaculia bacterium]|nr:hypothetical protein [Thermoanaerobaculia bacterium]